MALIHDLADELQTLMEKIEKLLMDPSARAGKLRWKYMLKMDSVRSVLRRAKRT